MRTLSELSAALIIVFAVAAPASRSFAQDPDAAKAPAAGTQNRDNGTFDISADGDLEWLQQDKAYVARGNAVAKRGTVTLNGDILIGYYRNRVEPQAAAAQPAATGPAEPGPAKPDQAQPGEAKSGQAKSGETKSQAKPGQEGFDTGNTDIWRVVGQGNVHISSEGRDAWGDRMDYDKDQQVVVLTGSALKATTPTETVTARDSLEYWQDKNMGVARGDAVVTKTNGQTLAADLIGAHFDKDADGHTSLKTIQADGHVVITTATDIVHGDRGTYDLAARRTVVFGNVRVTRGQNQLEGESAEVNMDTGISQIFPGRGKRVRGLFVQEKNQPASGAAAPAPARSRP